MRYGSFNRPNATQSARSWSGRHLRRSKSEATISLSRALLRYENTQKKLRSCKGTTRYIDHKLLPSRSTRYCEGNLDCSPIGSLLGIFTWSSVSIYNIYARRRISSTDRKPHYEALVYSTCTQSSRASTSSSFILTTRGGGSRYVCLLRESSLAVAEQGF